MRALPIILCAACGAPEKVPPSCAEGDPDALLACSEASQPEDHYVEAALAYFDTMDSRVPLVFPAYSERVVRWEWPPWLKLTGYTREVIEVSDTLLRSLYPSVVDNRDCRAFSTAPFARCRITFAYEAHDNLPCPIYEEFAFNEAGEITWIEAWSDQPGLLPLDAEADPWAESAGFPRLAARIPGLGSPSGWIEPQGEAMQEVAASDPEVADFVRRTEDFAGTWAEEEAAAGEEMWAEGCGW
jgi:hypothetical protein